MVDIHHHILPGLDDGPADWATSVEMARQAWASGVAAVVATPHLTPGQPGGISHVVIGERLDELRGRLVAEGIELEVFAGAEVYPTPDLVRHLESGRIPTLGHGGRVRYLLVDTPFDLLPPHFDRLLFEVRLAAMTPVIAHPERSAALAAHPERLEELVSQGALAQVTAGSLLGRFGSRAYQAGWTFVSRGLACAVASDAHGPTDRAPSDLGRAMQEVERRLGLPTARALFVTHPRRIATGQPLDAPEADGENLPAQQAIEGLRARPGGRLGRLLANWGGRGWKAVMGRMTGPS